MLGTRVGMRRADLTRSLPLTLLYHAFGDRQPEQDPHNLFVTAEAFSRQLLVLANRGWRALSLADYLAGWERLAWPRRGFLLTMDDGYRSTLQIAAPILKAHRVPAVVFIPAGLVGATSRWMPRMPDETLLDEPDIRQLAEFGVDVGVHGYDHTDLVDLPDAELHRQCHESRNLLTKMTGSEPQVFAYPSGRFDSAGRDAVVAAGYAAAFSIRSARDRFAVPRVDINATDTPRTFGLKLSRYWQPALSALNHAPALRRGAHRLIGSLR
jgi:peptidoglycan/xylan/chitin deacetylase (PgdA/CDA1 family)